MYARRSPELFKSSLNPPICDLFKPPIPIGTTSLPKPQSGKEESGFLPNTLSSIATNSTLGL